MNEDSRDIPGLSRSAEQSESDGKPPEVTSESLLAGHREILIRHGEAVYRLRLTRNGKLILQK
ncbi:MAG: hemin uptake protein HemP [Planctomycetaceae bacterium]